MEIRETKRADVMIVSPVGRLESKSSPEMERRVSALLAAGNRQFVVDFGELDYISSAGLRVLLMLGKKLTGSDGKLALCGMNASVREVFDIAGFSTVFTIVPSLEEAVRAVDQTIEQRVSDLAARLLGGNGKQKRPTLQGASAGAHVGELTELAVRLLTIAEERDTGAKPRPLAAPEPQQPAAPPPPAAPLHHEVKAGSSRAWGRLAKWFGKE
jgi:anti-anti-sigma factor